MCTNIDGTQHHITLKGLTAGNKEKASKDVVLSTGTQELGSNTLWKNFSRYRELSCVLRLDLRCRTSRLSLDPTPQGSRCDNVHCRNKRQQQLYGVVILVLTYARYVFSETGTTQCVK